MTLYTGQHAMSSRTFQRTLTNFIDIIIHQVGLMVENDYKNRFEKETIKDMSVVKRCQEMFKIDLPIVKKRLAKFEAACDGIGS